MAAIVINKNLKLFLQAKYFTRLTALYTTGADSGKKRGVLPPKTPTSPEQPLKTKDTDKSGSSVTHGPPRPSDGKSYLVPEYYDHDKFSFSDYELQMKEMRLPQPSNKTPLPPKN